MKFLGNSIGDIGLNHSLIGVLRLNESQQQLLLCYAVAFEPKEEESACKMWAISKANLLFLFRALVLLEAGDASP